MLIDIIKARGNIKRNDLDGDDVLALQILLRAAGYRVADDGVFGPRTDMVVRQFQKQHGLRSDGVVGPVTAKLLDNVPHEQLVATATPLVAQTPFNVAVPHDDTASLRAFYGNPSRGLGAFVDANVTHVACPWRLQYEGQPWSHPIPFHVRMAGNLKQAMDTIWAAASRDNSSPLLEHVHNYSGSGNFRPIEGSSRISTHGFWAAIDWDAEHLPLKKMVPKTVMPEPIVNAFLATGATWGGDFIGRKDPMHFQYAHE